MVLSESRLDLEKELNRQLDDIELSDNESDREEEDMILYDISDRKSFWKNIETTIQEINLNKDTNSWKELLKSVEESDTICQEVQESLEEMKSELNYANELLILRKSKGQNDVENQDIDEFITENPEVDDEDEVMSSYCEDHCELSCLAPCHQHCPPECKKFQNFLSIRQVRQKKQNEKEQDDLVRSRQSVQKIVNNQMKELVEEARSNLSEEEILWLETSDKHLKVSVERCNELDNKRKERESQLDSNLKINIEETKRKDVDIEIEISFQPLFLLYNPTFYDNNNYNVNFLNSCYNEQELYRLETLQQVLENQKFEAERRREEEKLKYQEFLRKLEKEVEIEKEEQDRKLFEESVKASERQKQIDEILNMEIEDIFSQKVHEYIKKKRKEYTERENQNQLRELKCMREEEIIQLRIAFVAAKTHEERERQKQLRELQGMLQEEFERKSYLAHLRKQESRNEMNELKKMKNEEKLLRDYIHLKREMKKKEKDRSINEMKLMRLEEDYTCRYIILLKKNIEKEMLERNKMHQEEKLQRQINVEIEKFYRLEVVIMTKEYSLMTVEDNSGKKLRIEEYKHKQIRRLERRNDQAKKIIFQLFEKQKCLAFKKWHIFTQRFRSITRIQKTWRSRMSKLRQAAGAVQSAFRGFHIRRKIDAALAHAKYFDDDDYEYKEIDVDAFFGTLPNVEDNWIPEASKISKQSNQYQDVLEGGWINPPHVDDDRERTQGDEAFSMERQEYEEESYEARDESTPEKWAQPSQKEYLDEREEVNDSLTEPPLTPQYHTRKSIRQKKEELAQQWGLTDENAINMLWKRHQKAKKMQNARNIRAKNEDPQYRLKKLYKSANRDTENIPERNEDERVESTTCWSIGNGCTSSPSKKKKISVKLPRVART